MLFSGETLRKISGLFDTPVIYQKISLFKYLSIAPLENCKQLFTPVIFEFLSPVLSVPSMRWPVDLFEINGAVL
ncbi:hypothetical protein A3860_01625 [Niastella vici]|uniref:Uncharacterized protein n=1 Tax=Niastella vici TaxID=1703345 RepID=A0A1V9G966_9BACT|nr:hypothetical protein A3860_01625 [Niastella vici]